METETNTQTHLQPASCYVCGGTEAQHPRAVTASSTHASWSNASRAALTCRVWRRPGYAESAHVTQTRGR